MTDRNELYQQVILEHNRKPRNYRAIVDPTHSAEGYNPLCGDHFRVYLRVRNGIIDDIAFDGSGCAISKASASMMTSALKDKTFEEARLLFAEFHDLIVGKIQPESNGHHLGKLAVFSGIWQYPARVKCATLSWHAMKGALDKTGTVTTENEGETPPPPPRGHTGET